MKYCPHCGHEINKNAIFCLNCGERINSDNKATALPNRKTEHKTPVNLFLIMFIIAIIVISGYFIFLYSSGATNKVSTTPPSGKIKQTKTNTDNVPKKEVTNKSDDQAHTPLWNSSKNNQLINFMTTFGSQMNQNYDYYNPENQDNYMGYHFPADLDHGNVQVNGSPVSIGWSDDGSGSNDYNVVAIYSDLDSDRNKFPKVAPHLYLFTIHNGQPTVLITQQTQGNPENAIYFNPTNNQELSSQFANIVNNQQ